MGKKLEVLIEEQKAKIQKIKDDIKAIEAEPTYATKHAELTRKLQDANNAEAEARIAKQAEEKRVELRLGVGDGVEGKFFRYAIAKFIGADDEADAINAASNATNHDHRFGSVFYSLRRKIIAADVGVQLAESKRLAAFNVQHAIKKERDELETNVNLIRWRLRYAESDLHTLEAKLKKRDDRREEKVIALHAVPEEERADKEARDREIRRKLKLLAEGELEFTYNGITINRKDHAS